MNEKGIWKEKRKGVDDYLYALRRRKNLKSREKQEPDFFDRGPVFCAYLLVFAYFIRIDRKT